MSRPFIFQPLFVFQVWPDLERNKDSADPPGELLRPLTRSCFLLPLLERFSLLALNFLLRTCLPSLWSLPFPPCSPSDPSLSRKSAALAHLDSRPPHNLGIWTDGFVRFCFGKTTQASLPNAPFMALWSPFLFGSPSMFKFCR